MSKFRHFRDVIVVGTAYVVAKIIKMCSKNREVYLIGERDGEARDNGYHLFKYIRKNYSKDSFFYVINKDSKDLEKISEYGNIIYQNSFKHYVYYVLADKLVCAHLGSCIPKSTVCWKLQGLGIIKKYKIFIQHGITISNHNSLMYPNSGMDEFICGGKLEYDYVRKNFGYPEDKVKYLGFCRFDNLHNCKTKNQILVMPTWRGWLGATWGGDDYSEFLEAKYYKRFKSLIKNKELQDLLESHNMNLVFYPHYEMQKYIKYFKSHSNRIVIADKENYDVQNLLKESKILITDYSSIAFDFAYMRKPIIYYQFDKDEYYSNHYVKGYFDYDSMGFGEIVFEEEELVTSLEKILLIENNEFNYNVEKFFNLFDDRNCERTYQEIIRQISIKRG